MKIFFAFSAEPLQLKFLNWVLGRNDIDKNVMMDAVRNKDAGFVDAISKFTEFQSEAKKYATKIGNSSNIFLDCIYDRCANDDDSFKYVFGEDNDPVRFKKSYEHVLNELYDAFRNCEDFSKEGRFMKRSKEVFNMFKQKKESLENIVKAMNQILIDNNKNSGNESDGRTMDEMERDSWENLESQEVFSRGEWHVYRVDEYEDLRNVASECSEWCVARKDSGRDYFYREYGPPYYLFSKGRRNPFILMHIESQQFKGLDDSKFEADRPTSYEAIEIGREFLDDMGELREYSDYEDFSVFNEENEFEDEPELDDFVNMRAASEEELKRMLDSTEDTGMVMSIVNSTREYDTLMEALDKSGDRFDEVARLIVRKNLPQWFGEEKSLKIYVRILDECVETFNENLKNDLIPIILLYVDSERIVEEIAELYCDKDKIASIIDSEKFRECTPAFIEYLSKNGMWDSVEDIFQLNRTPMGVLDKIIDIYHDDYEMMKERVSHHFKANETIVVHIIQKTGNKQLIDYFIDLMVGAQALEFDWKIQNEIMKALWKKNLDDSQKERLFQSSIGFHDEEAADIMLSSAKTKEEEIQALHRGASQQTIEAYFDSHLDGLEYSESISGDWHALMFFSQKIKDPQRLHRLFEKVGYSLKFVTSALGSNGKVQIPDVLKSIEASDKLEEGDVATILQHYTNGSVYIEDDNEHNELLKACLIKCNTTPVANTEIKITNNGDVIRFIIENGMPSVENILMRIDAHKELQDEALVRRVADIAMKRNAIKFYGKIAQLKNCPLDAIEKLKDLHDDKDDYDLVELGKGMKQDEKAFIDDYCSKGADTDRLMKLIGQCLNSKERFALAMNEIVMGGIVPKKDKVLFLERLFKFEHGGQIRQDMSIAIDWCIQNEQLLDDALCVNGITEEQANRVMDAIEDSDYYMTNIETAFGGLSQTAIKVVKKRVEEDELEVDWTNLVRNPESTAEELEMALDFIEGTEYNTEEIDMLLQHKNCTQELADRAMESLDFDQYIDDGGDLNTLLNWTGARILNMKGSHGYQVNVIDSLYKLVDVATIAKNDQELEDVIDYIGMVENNDSDEDEDSTSVSDVVLRAIGNKNCSVALFEKLMEKFKGMAETEDFIFSFIVGHRTMSPDEFDAFVGKYKNTIKASRRCASELEKCSGATPEQLIEVLRMTNFMNDTSLLMNPSTNDKVILEALDYANQDGVVSLLVRSYKATEEVYEKAVDMNVGEHSLEEVAKHTKNPELVKRVESMLANQKDGDYGIVASINRETDDEKLKTLVERLYKQCASLQSSQYSSNDVSRIGNQKAIEMISRTKNQNILSAIVKNVNAPSRIVMQILKKYPSKLNLSSGSRRVEKEILLYVACVSGNEDDIDNIFRMPETARQFTSDDVMKMLKWNPSCKFDILKRTYFKLSREQLLSLKKLHDKDVDWIVDAILKNDGENTAKASRIVKNILKAGRIIRNIALEYAGGQNEQE